LLTAIFLGGLEGKFKFDIDSKNYIFLIIRNTELIAELSLPADTDALVKEKKIREASEKMFKKVCVLC
jgi:hypothetical protein